MTSAPRCELFPIRKINQQMHPLEGQASALAQLDQANMYNGVKMGAPIFTTGCELFHPSKIITHWQTITAHSESAGCTMKRKLLPAGMHQPYDASNECASVGCALNRKLLSAGMHQLSDGGHLMRHSLKMLQPCFSASTSAFSPPGAFVARDLSTASPLTDSSA